MIIMMYDWEQRMRRGIMIPPKGKSSKGKSRLRVRLKEIKDRKKFYGWARQQGFKVDPWDNCSPTSENYNQNPKGKYR